MSKKLRTFSDKFWRDKNGKVVLMNVPNPPIIVWFVGLVLAKLLPGGGWQSAASIVSYGALFTWAWLEIFYGVNYFRRTLGMIILVFSVVIRS